MRRVFCLLALILVTACGQSGDLYLPTETATTAPQPAPETPAEDIEKKKESP